MLDLLIILPYNAAGQSIDWASDFVLTQVATGRMHRHAKTKMAQGVAQAEAALRKDRFREILLVEYQAWGPGTTEVWGLIENQRVFDKAHLRFADGGPASRW